MTRAVPLYILPHNIEVISERVVGGRYVYCYLRPHPLLYFRPNVARSRVMMTAKLGRKLKRTEHVHHGVLGIRNDSWENIELMNCEEHNRHHKLGSRHREDSKSAISKGLKKAFAEGRRKRPDLHGKKNPFFGRHHTEETKKKIGEARRR